MVDWAGTMGTGKISEWMWRFLAAVMLFAVGWTIWIFYQLNPPALVTDAAFTAAAKAKANAPQNAGQSTQGVIAPAAAPDAPKEPAAPKEPKVPKVPSEPPINADKLKFSDSLSDKK